jgi:hypothetical protein
VIIESVYNGRNNSNDLLLKADGVAVDLATTVTRMQLIVGTKTVDSTTTPTAFDWTPAPAVAGKVILTLGAAGLTVGVRQVAELIVYDAANPLGINWGKFYLDVFDDTP